MGIWETIGKFLLGDRVVYNAAAWQQLAAALTQPLWVAVPVIQILVAVFPWRVNGWFGIGFLVYYLLMTPLLFEVAATEAAHPYVISTFMSAVHFSQRSLCVMASAGRRYATLQALNAA